MTNGEMIGVWELLRHTGCGNTYKLTSFVLDALPRVFPDCLQEVTKLLDYPVESKILLEGWIPAGPGTFRRKWHPLRRLPGDLQ